MEDRRPQFVEALRQSEGLTPTQAGKVLDLSIDRLVWYAGWADKITQVTGNANPVAGPFFNLSTPEPTGVVAVVAPQQSSLLGLVSRRRAGRRDRQHRRGAELATSGRCRPSRSPRCWPPPTSRAAWSTSSPARLANTAPTLASHMDVNGIDLTGFAGDTEQATALEEAAAENLKRVLRAPATEPDWTVEPGIGRMTTFLETKTVWHPIGV